MTNGYESSVVIVTKTEINFNCIQRLCSSYSERNSLGLHDTTEKVNAAQGIHFTFFVRIIGNAIMHSVERVVFQCKTGWGV